MRPLLGRSSAHFDSVVRAYTAELYHFALWLARDRHRAEDILQEALTRAWRNWNHVQDEGGRRAWLYAIVRNEFYREARNATRREETLDDEALAAVADERDFTRGLELRQILERLPAGALEPLVLQNLGGLTCEEVARVLGLSVGATMTRMSRGRALLRESMREPEGRARETTHG